MKFWRNIILLILAVWGIAAGLIHWARAEKPTAESITAYLSKHSLDTGNEAGRAKIIARVADMMNGVNLEERQALQNRGVTRNFFRSLTPSEQANFLDATLPAGFKQMMESFNKMEPEKRKRIVERALEEARKHQGETPPVKMDDQLAQKLVNQGLRSFYSDASADVKLDLAPLIEQMQINLQSTR